MNKPLILVVEDDPSVRNLITTTLKTNDYRYVVAPNGSAAIMEATSHNPEIILLDLGLPDMDGIQVIQTVRSWSNVPIIVISARSEDNDKIKALDALAAKERRQAAWGVAEDRGYLLGMREVCHVLAVRLGIATGMRLGEVLGLTWGAVDFGHGLVSVVRTLKADGTLKEPKTEAGRRVVAVDAVTMAHLKAWKALQAEALDTLCIDVGEASPVLCSATGGFLGTANFERWWRSFRTGAGFPDLRYHELRHTQATQLLAQGVDVKTVQARLGHSDASLTLNWYAHAVPENDRAAADRLGELFREEPKPCRIVELKSA